MGPLLGAARHKLEASKEYCPSVHQPGLSSNIGAFSSEQRSHHVVSIEVIFGPSSTLTPQTMLLYFVNKLYSTRSVDFRSRFTISGKGIIK